MVILYLEHLKESFRQQSFCRVKTILNVHNVETQPSSVFLIPKYNKIPFEKEPIIGRLDFSPLIGVLIIEEWTPGRLDSDPLSSATLESPDLCAPVTCPNFTTACRLTSDFSFIEVLSS